MPTYHDRIHLTFRDGELVPPEAAGGIPYVVVDLHIFVMALAGSRRLVGLELAPELFKCRASLGRGCRVRSRHMGF
jgi:hypothetical protein